MIWFAAFASIAERVDQRGIKLKYTYDTLGRNVRTEIDDSAWFNPSGPDHRVQQIDYEYEPTGEQSLVTSYGLDGAAGAPLAQNQFTYDAWRNLLQDWQGHAAEVDAATPVVDYAWSSPADEGGGNYIRPYQITYPLWPGASARRWVRFAYDSLDGAVDDALSRVSSIRYYHLTNLARYSYAGTSRRVGVTFKTKVEWNAARNDNGVAVNDGYPSLDRFGRIVDLHYAKATVPLTTAHRYQYGYDPAGNRTYSRVTQQQSPYFIKRENERSYLYEYDGLQRLISAERGKLSFSGGVPHIQWAGSVHPVERNWTLDNLGNWPAVEEKTDADGDGYAPWEMTFELHHGVNRANEITQIILDPDGSGSTVETIIWPKYDPAGNQVYDGNYVYQYDGLNRLVQVNEAGTASFDEDGRMTGGSLGNLILRYTYDGLGRLIRKETPTSPSDPRIRYEDYYYDP